MRTRLRGCLVALALTLIVPFLGAEESGLEYIASLRLWGADLGIGYYSPLIAPGLSTTLWAKFGGAYETYQYWRDGSGRILESASADQVAYDDLNFAWALGLDQGILPGAGGKDSLAAFAYYRGRAESRYTQAGDLVLGYSGPDLGGAFANSLLIGLRYDTSATGPVSGVKRGTSAEASLEWGPSFLSAQGNDYLRLNATARQYVPLMETTGDSGNLASLYLALFGSVDFATGTSVPLFVRQSFGGVFPRYGLGAALRGVDDFRYDTNLKAVANLELRFNGPSFIVPNLYPIVVLFYDMGYFDQVGEAAAAGSLSGFRNSVGAEAYLNLIDLAQVGGRIVYSLDANKAGQRLSIELSFGLMF
jgi:hypothetical protein